MKIERPAETIEVCDVCRRENCTQPLTECLACGSLFCLTCRAIIGGCWVGPNICRACNDREDVLAVVDKHAKRITPIIRERDRELRRLRGH